MPMFKFKEIWFKGITLALSHVKGMCSNHVVSK